VKEGKQDIDTLIVLLYDSEEHYQEKSIQSWSRETVFENTHVQRFELIEEVLIQIHGVVFVSCMRMLNGMFMVLLFLFYTFAFMLCMNDFLLNV
jgi:hypothetical protein